MTYTRDIDHCPGNGCPLREECVRYRLGQMPEHAQEQYTWWVSEEYDTETNACENMLMIKDK